MIVKPLFPLVGLLLLVHPAAAQEAIYPSRDGFWMSFGAGAAGQHCVSGSCSSQGVLSPALHLQLGATVSPTVKLGIGLNGWPIEYDAIAHVAGSFIGLFYPSPRSGFFLIGGVGVMAGVDAPDDRIISGPIIDGGLDAGVDHGLA